MKNIQYLPFMSRRIFWQITRYKTSIMTLNDNDGFSLASISFKAIFSSIFFLAVMDCQLVRGAVFCDSHSICRRQLAKTRYRCNRNGQEKGDLGRTCHLRTGRDGVYLPKVVHTCFPSLYQVPSDASLLSLQIRSADWPLVMFTLDSPLVK